MKRKVWSGRQIDGCDICEHGITNKFIDGKTIFGPWAIMCPTCHSKHGVGLGLGRGQKYQRQGPVFVRTEV